MDDGAAAVIARVEALARPRAPYPEPGICPVYVGGSLVLDTRPRDNFIHRRRKCAHCGARWQTHEYTSKITRTSDT